MREQPILNIIEKSKTIKVEDVKGGDAEIERKKCSCLGHCCCYLFGGDNLTGVDLSPFVIQSGFMKEQSILNIIQEAKAISAEFREIEAEYNSPDSLIDSGNWYYISKKQDEIISRLVDVLENERTAQRKELESLCTKAEMGLTDIYAQDIRAILRKYGE